MNNNNRGNNSNNNRRRGRGNNNRPQGGGRGEQLNRIDSRARGNAPQMLEKYRKLAQDAHLNGDRVTAESYLQYADHYFRVIADARVRQDEQRQRTDRPSDEDGDDFDYGPDNDFPTFDQPIVARREDRRDEPRRDERRDERRPFREEPGEAAASDGEAVSEPRANPFTRDNRETRAARAPRGERRERSAELAEPQTPEEQHGIDQDALPPAIEGSRGSEGDQIELTPAAPVDDGAAPAPRRRARRPRAAPAGDDTTGGPLEAVNG